MGWAERIIGDTPSLTSGRSYTYKGLMLCRTCGFNVTAYTKIKKLSTGVDCEYIFYTCTKKSRRIKCSEPQVSATSLENEVIESISNFEISESEAAQCRTALRQLHASFTAKRNQYKSLETRD